MLSGVKLDHECLSACSKTRDAWIGSAEETSRSANIVCYLSTPFTASSRSSLSFGTDSTARHALGVRLSLQRFAEFFFVDGNVHYDISGPCISLNLVAHSVTAKADYLNLLRALTAIVSILYSVSTVVAKSLPSRFISHEFLVQSIPQASVLLMNSSLTDAPQAITEHQILPSLFRPSYNATAASVFPSRAPTFHKSLNLQSFNVIFSP